MERKRGVVLFNRQSFPSNVFFSKKSFSLFLSDISNKNILIIHGKTFNLAGLDLLIDKKLAGNHLEYLNIHKIDILLEFNKIRQKNLSPDIIISIGGGSAIDIGKFFVAGFQICKDDDEENLYNAKNIDIDSFLSRIKKDTELQNKIMHHVIVTKPGSGAETSKAMIINTKTNKFVLAKDYFLPNNVFYYENAYKSLPHSEKLFGLADSLTHAWESFGSPVKNNFVNYLSKPIIDFICNDISGEQIATENYTQSSFFGGMLQSDTGSGLTHAFAHSIEYKSNENHAKLIFFSLPFAFIYWHLYSKYNSLDNLFIEHASKIQIAHSRLVAMLSMNEMNGFNALKSELNLYNKEKIINDLLQDPCARLTPKKLEKDLLLETLDIFIKEKWN
jgi:alcohol dehydrogenase class IV